ncbi:MAG TPA: guanylate kinase [Gaiellaceae bacterium]|nr:guanylate kinase [Gaiellaceae bacterium]HWH04995.1 guanylate kinase [Gaiellaceae bacterium]
MPSSTSSDLPVFVITGPSGAGKGTLERELLRRRPGRVELAVSATTRPRRPGEEDGVHYWFLTRDEFEQRIANDGFLEWVEYVGNRYGTLRSEIDRIQEAGRAPLLDLEVEGALRVRDEVPGSITIFVDAPVEELERRLHARATESSGEIGDRIELARRQKEQAAEFDHVIENDDLERATEELLAIVDRSLAAAGTLSE